MIIAAIGSIATSMMWGWLLSLGFLALGAALDIDTFDAALKQLYDNKRVRTVVYKNNPLHAMVPKFTVFEGRNMPLVLTSGNPQGRSASFATAQSNKTAGVYRDFLLTRTKDYGLTSIELETIQASASDRGAFMRGATAEIDGILNQVARSLSIAEYRNGGGAIGRILSGEGTPTITLVDPTDATAFEVGMKLQVSVDDGTGGAGVRVGTVSITAVDRNLGTVTASGNWTAGIPAVVANDFIFVQGDYNAKIKGLDAWLPVTVTAPAFFGVVRTEDPVRLGGVKHDGSGQTTEEALIDAAAKTNAIGGGTPDYVFMHPRNVRDLVKLLDSRIEYHDVKPGGLPEDAEIGFRAVLLQADHGILRVVADRNCIVDTAFMLQLDTWVLASLGEAPKILEGLGQRFIWDANADSVEIRTGYYGQLGCMAPGYNCRVTLPSTSGT
jgi:hypothetical protein